MAPDQDDGTNPRIAATVPTYQKRALEDYAFSRSTSTNRVYISDLIREAIDEYLHRHMNDLPEETRDLLDDDLIANAGNGGTR